MHLSLISATIPVLRPVIMNLSTSYSSLGPKESSTGYGYSAGTYQLSTMKPSRVYNAGKGKVPKGSSPSADFDLGVFPSSSVQSRNVENRNSLRTDSIESHNSAQMIIRKQISWRVERGEVERPQ
jgi:hypothetical protein